jgi:hypothetical protein
LLIKAAVLWYFEPYATSDGIGVGDPRPRNERIGPVFRLLTLGDVFLLVLRGDGILLEEVNATSTLPELTGMDWGSALTAKGDLNLVCSTGTGERCRLSVCRPEAPPPPGVALKVVECRKSMCLCPLCTKPSTCIVALKSCVSLVCASDTFLSWSRRSRMTTSEPLRRSSAADRARRWFSLS